MPQSGQFWEVKMRFKKNQMALLEYINSGKYYADMEAGRITHDSTIQSFKMTEEAYKEVLARIERNKKKRRPGRPIVKNKKENIISFYLSDAELDLFRDIDGRKKVKIFIAEILEKYAKIFK
jgi:hypothetical protein